MNILVTGASGFIGSFLVQKLIEEGHQVVGIDNFSDYYSVDLKRQRVAKMHVSSNRAEIVNVDISNKSDLEKVFLSNNFHVVVHLAAQAGVRLPAQNYVDSNILGFLNLLDLLKKYGVTNCLFASSSSVYGNSSTLPYRENDTNLHPMSFYGLTKKLNEEYANVVHMNFSVKFRAMRFFTVYGPWGRPDMAYFRLISAALNRDFFKLFGDGSIQRDFTFVTDVVSVINQLLNELVSKSETRFFDRVNIGGERPLSINYLIAEIERQTKEKIDISVLDPNSSDSKITVASRDYLESLIGRREYIPLEEGISKTLAWATSPEVISKLSSWVQSTKK